MLQAVEVEYRPIEGYPGYRVGNDGTVWTCWKRRGGRSPDGSYSGVVVLSDRWKQLKQGRRGGNKAGSVDLRKDGRTIHRFVHQLVLEAFIGPCPVGMVARHGPHGKYNNHLYNLSWGTQKENIADKERDGTRIYGIVHHNAKMDPDKVRSARQQYAEGVSILSLSFKFGIAKTTMRSILKRETWKEVS